MANKLIQMQDGVDNIYPNFNYPNRTEIGASENINTLKTSEHYKITSVSALTLYNQNKIPNNTTGIMDVFASIGGDPNADFVTQKLSDYLGNENVRVIGSEDSTIPTWTDWISTVKCRHIDSSMNLNTLTTIKHFDASGLYTWGSSQPTNAPFQYGLMIQIGFLTARTSSDGGKFCGIQIVGSYGSNNLKYRRCSQDIWDSWKTITMT